MKGVVVMKAKIMNEDNRRKLIEIMNGQLSIKNLKILEVKEYCYLGGTSGHYHLYPEVMFILKGKAHNYVMTNIDTKETKMFELEEGDVVFRSARIIHGGYFEAGTIVIDGSCETYISSDFNDIPREIVE